jgi:heptosyltransferase-3
LRDLNRILVIRGGAIGDFILTLPMLKALRDAYPESRIEILGYKHIAALAENRFYAQAARSIEYGPLSSFFAKDSELPTELAIYFAGFDLILSYLYDPDGIFENNLRRCGARQIVRGPAKIDSSAHAAQQLAKPIEVLGLRVTELAAKFYPSTQDRQFARDFLKDRAQPVVALHPGSGSEKKNWPLKNWVELGNSLAGPFVVISGEADADQIAVLENEWKDRHVLFAKNLPLPQLAAALEGTVFVGNDSGISHLAAAAGADCILLFGPTNPEVWAPLNENVRVLKAPGNDLARLDVDLVRDALDQALIRIGMRT